MKKRFVITITLLMSTTFFLNCREKKVLFEVDFEQSVFYELFPELFDALHFDLRLIPDPPPPSPEYLIKGGYDAKSEYTQAYEDWKKSAEYQEILEDRKRIADSIKNDTTSMYFIVQDSAYSPKNSLKKELVDHFTAKDISSDSIDLNLGFKINISKLITKHSKVKFKYGSEFPKGKEYWPRRKESNIIASLDFSGIIFDQTKNYGVLEAGYVKGRLNGGGIRIFIRKTDKGKWVIDKIVETWVS